MLSADEVLDDIALRIEGGEFTANDGAMWGCQGSVLDPGKSSTRIVAYETNDGTEAVFRVAVTAVTT